MHSNKKIGHLPHGKQLNKTHEMHLCALALQRVYITSLPESLL